MRRFRGKRKDNGKWVYGYYRYHPYYEIHLISYFEERKELADKVPNGIWREFEVDPETVGQFTDQYDKKRTEEYPEGQEIYGGDIVTSGRPTTCWKVGEVMFRSSAFRVHAFVLCQLPNCEVVGNKTENPELLEQEGVAL